MKRLRLLDVGSNQLGSESIQHIIDSLHSDVPLRKLAMSYTQLSPGHVMQLAQILKTNLNLEALYLCTRMWYQEQGGLQACTFPIYSKYSSTNTKLE